MISDYESLTSPWQVIPLNLNKVYYYSLPKRNLFLSWFSNFRSNSSASRLSFSLSESLFFELFLTGHCLEFFNPFTFTGFVFPILLGIYPKQWCEIKGEGKQFSPMLIKSTKLPVSLVCCGCGCCCCYDCPVFCVP